MKNLIYDRKALFSPEILAAKFVKTSLDHLNAQKSDIDQLRSTLLSFTLEHAWKFSKYYRSVLPKTVKNGKFPIDKLCEIPLLKRKDIRDYSKLLRTSKDAGIIQYTTGTTGVPISVFRTEKEMKFLREFHIALQNIIHGTTKKAKPLILNIPNIYHGSVIDIPIHGYRLSTGIFDSSLINQIILWLTTAHNIPGVEHRISVITGLYEFIQWLTYVLIEREFDFRKTKIKRIYSVGGFLTSRWQSLLKNLWSAEIISVYSITEVFTYANQCQSCGGYHFLPNVIPELIYPLERTSVESEIGELVLTGLYPFIQGQPVIRYATRDIFRLKKNHCSYGDSYIFLGRADNSCFLQIPNEYPIVISSKMISDALDSIPEVATTPFFNDFPGIKDNGAIGKPKFIIKLNCASKEHPRVRIEVELTYNPLLYSTHTKQLKRTILRKMCQKCSGIRTLIKKKLGAVDLIFHAPGSITNKNIEN